MPSKRFSCFHLISFTNLTAEKTTVGAVIKINAERLLIYGFEIPLGDHDAILSFCATYH